MDKLDHSEITKRLATLEGWELSADGSIHRQFISTNFVAAFGFMCSVALLAEKLNHHPDWSNSYNKVDIHLSSHEADGLSETDFELAAKINELASK